MAVSASVKDARAPVERTAFGRSTFYSAVIFTENLTIVWWKFRSRADEVQPSEATKSSRFGRSPTSSMIPRLTAARARASSSRAPRLSNPVSNTASPFVHSSNFEYSGHFGRTRIQSAPDGDDLGIIVLELREWNPVSPACLLFVGEIEYPVARLDAVQKTEVKHLALTKRRVQVDVAQQVLRAGSSWSRCAAPGPSGISR